MAAKKKAAPKAKTSAKKAPRAKKQATSSAKGESAAAHEWLMQTQAVTPTPPNTTELILYAEPVQEEHTEEPKRGRGRPTDYRIEYCTQVEKLCRLGATDAEIAVFFNIAEATLYNWKKEHPEFVEAMREGKMMSDMRVADALYRKATGYVMEVERIMGKGDNARIVKFNVTVEPDVQACSLWLRNRRGENWRDKKDVEVTYRHEDALEALINETGDEQPQPAERGDQRDRAVH